MASLSEASKAGIGCDGSGLKSELSSAGGGGGGGSGGGGGLGSAPSESWRQVLKNLEKYHLIDIREEEELVEPKLPAEGAQCIPMGRLIREAVHDTPLAAELKTRQRIAVYCNTLTRSKATAAVLRGVGYDCVWIDGGITSYYSPPPVAFHEQFAITLMANHETSAEKTGLALNLVNASSTKGRTTTLVLMADGVVLATKAFHASGATLGEHFPPPVESLMKFLDSKGQILVCTSCLKQRGLTPDDLVEGFTVIKGPDAVETVVTAQAHTSIC